MTVYPICYYYLLICHISGFLYCKSPLTMITSLASSLFIFLIPIKRQVAAFCLYLPSKKVPCLTFLKKTPISAIVSNMCSNNCSIKFLLQDYTYDTFFIFNYFVLYSFFQLALQHLLISYNH